MPHSTTRSTPDASAVRRIDPVLYRLRMLSKSTTMRWSEGSGIVVSSEVLSLLERQLNAALGAGSHTRDRRTVGGKLAGVIPRLRVRKFEVDPAILHREAAQRLIDWPFLRERRANQFAEHRAVGILHELQLDVVIDRLDNRPSDPLACEGIGDIRGDLDRLRFLFLRVRALVTRRRRVVRNDGVALVTRVFPPLVIGIVAHRVAYGERAGEYNRILGLDLVEPHIVVQPGDPLRRLHLIALRETISRWRSDNRQVDRWRVAAFVIGGFDDERVAVPSSARFAHVLLVRGFKGWPPIGVDDARVVDHFELEHDDPRRLPDREAAVIPIRHHGRGHAARGAAVPAVEVRGPVVGRRLAGQRPAAAHLERALFTLGGERRQQSARRIDDERGLPLWSGRVSDAREQRAAEFTFLDQLTAQVASAGSLVDPLLVFL